MRQIKVGIQTNIHGPFLIRGVTELPEKQKVFCNGCIYKVTLLDENGNLTGVVVQARGAQLKYIEKYEQPAR